MSQITRVSSLNSFSFTAQTKKSTSVPKHFSTLPANHPPGFSSRNSCSYPILSSQQTFSGLGFLKLNSNTVFSSKFGKKSPKKLIIMASSDQQSVSSVVMPIIKHSVILSVPVLITSLFFNGSLFGYHPSLLAFGYLFFMGEGILASLQAKGKQRQLYLNIHYAFQVLALLSISAGMFAIYKNKNLAGKSHLLTLHARLGALTLLSSFFVFLGGLPVFYGLPKRLKKMTAQLNRGHKIFGAISFFGALITSVYGLQVFNPSHPLHKGNLTYLSFFGILLTAFVILSSTFAVSEMKKKILTYSKKSN